MNRLTLMVAQVPPTSRMRFNVPDVWDESPLTRSQRRELARQQQAIYDARRQHVALLRDVLPPPLCTLLDLPLDDAFMTLIAVDRPARELRLYLRHWVPEDGNFHVCQPFDKAIRLRLRFKNVVLSWRDVQTLRLVARQGDRADVKACELDVAPDGETSPYICRFQWNTQLVANRDKKAGIAYLQIPEIELRFDALDLEVTPEISKHVSSRCLFRLR